MVAPRTDDSPRDPEQRALHAFVRAHLESWLAARIDEQGAGLPAFVVEELRAFLACGVAAHGVARYRCEKCNASRLVALSCKGRGFCPRCGGRRMTERALHLVTRILPRVRIRQWVLTLPFSLRARAAFNHDLALAIGRIAYAAVARHYGGRTGAVTALQRFGGDLRLNLHFHTLFLDGTYPRKGRFVPARPPTAADVARVLAEIVAGVTAHLAALADTEPESAGALGAAYTSASRTIAERSRPDDADHAGVPPAPLLQHTRAKARLDGFDLDASTSVSGRNSARREQLCRYILRPPFSEERLDLLPGGSVQLTLKRPWSDGTTHVIMTAFQFLDRLASLIPRPRVNTTLYYGVLSPRSKARVSVVPAPAASHEADTPPRRNPVWADLMRHSFGLDVLACRRCRGRLRFMATSPAPSVRRFICASRCSILAPRWRGVLRITALLSTRADGRRAIVVPTLCSASRSSSPSPRHSPRARGTRMWASRSPR